jgi:5'-3' exoribonuclease 2
MLFVNGSHSLSPYIYSLSSKFGHLPDKDLGGIKEKLDPSARLAKLSGFLIVCVCVGGGGGGGKTFLF